MSLLLPCLLLLAAPPTLPPVTGNALDLVHADVMFIAAHPDDDGGVLATFARYILDEGYRGTVVTATGGEGGGNAIGPEAGRALGLVRQEEERRALAMVGVTQSHFLQLEDFHFTLSAEETLARWGDAYVCDVVRDVRLRRPSVILTMWPGPGTHGQHQMASRAATIAFDRAGDPSYCPEQITMEYLKPWAPAKLYYYPRGRTGSIAIPTDTVSPAAGQRYADMRAAALRQYRSQGYERQVSFPAKTAEPEDYLLVRSRVPVSDPETHLLEGAQRPAGTSPAGVRLEVEPEAYAVGVGDGTGVRVRLTNGSASVLRDARLSLAPPKGWSMEAPAEVPHATLEPGKSLETRYVLRPGAEATGDTTVQASYEAEGGARGHNQAHLKATPALEVAFAPTFDVAGYRRFAADTHTDWVITILPTRVPLVIGRTTPVKVEVTNHGTAPARGTLEIAGAPGVSLASPATFEAPAHGAVTVTVPVQVAADAPPAGRHSARLPITIRTTVDGRTVSDQADAYLLPSLVVPRLAHAPTIDGDLSDDAALAPAAIGPADNWWRNPARDAADLSADLRLGHDDRALYVALRVHDDAVVCNIAPDDQRGVQRSDAVAITVDPSGRAHDTSSTLQLALFPCTTAGWGAAPFRDADAHPGPAAQSLPGLQVATRRTDDGYTVEAAIPWAAMPGTAHAGDEIAVNAVVYDADDAKAAEGDNVVESGIAWAAFSIGGKQALPYLWPRVTLGR